jgi:hypothetical protein
MDAKQFGWLYMIENGHAGCKHNYYGGWDVIPGVLDQYDIKRNKYNGFDPQELRTKMIEEVRRVGVNWKKTGDVQSDRVHEFSDTFHDPDTREILTGTLVLLDGTRQEWVANAVEVTNVFEMMAQIHSAAGRFESVFGGQ